MALNEIGKAAALTHIVTVYDRVMHRMLMRCGCAGEPLGPPQMIGGVETYAVIYEVGPAWDARVRSLAGTANISIEPEAIRTMRERLAS
jgi:acyl homoserine lactone synthase